MRIVCPHCALELNAHTLARHVDKARCRARREAALLYARGLHPVELRYQAKSDHVAAALGLFGHVAELHPARSRPSTETWTSKDGAALALVIEEAARLLATSYPEAARRLCAHPELIGPFGTAWRLGTGDDEGSLREILQPIGHYRLREARGG